MAAFRESKDLVSIGAYQKGSNVNVDIALRLDHQIQAFLQQHRDEISPLEHTQQALLGVGAAIQQLRAEMNVRRVL